MPLDPHAAFMRAQREHDNATPPEGEDECKWHPWDEEANGPFDGRPCPDCEDAREAYEADSYDRMRDERMEDGY